MPYPTFSARTCGAERRPPRSAPAPAHGLGLQVRGQTLDPVLEAEAKNAGAVYVVKPLEATALLKIVRDLLAGRPPDQTTVVPYCLVPHFPQESLSCADARDAMSATAIRAFITERLPSLNSCLRRGGL